ncbi:MAG TPA: NAD-dependent epimerase/dehydratase family protein [Acidimicrobiales bacterium]
MQALVTGATGLLGRHLVEALLDRGDSVRALVLPAENTRQLEELGVQVYRGDVCDRESLEAPTNGVDTLFHLAALQGQWVPMKEYAEVNVQGTDNVCRAVLASGIRRLVHVSSWTIYGINRGWALEESVKPAPGDDPYWITKAQGDLLVQRWIEEHALPAAIVRPGTIFGVHDRLNFARVAEKIRAGKAIVIGSGRNFLPLVFVTDVVQGLLLCADAQEAEGEAFNITNDEPLTQRSFLDSVAVDLGVRPPRIHVPYPLALTAAAVAEGAAGFTRNGSPVVTRHGVKLYGTANRHSIQKARQRLGYQPKVTVREGVRLSCRWYEQEYGPAWTVNDRSEAAVS